MTRLPGLLDSTSVPLSLTGEIGDSYEYYPDGRLAYDRQDDSFFGQYVYDSYGNLVSENYNSTPLTYQYNPENQLISSTKSGVVTDYGYDTTNGWRTSQGPTSNPSQIQYGYNALGQMTSYSDSANSTTATYSYDAAGERTKSAVTQGSSSWTTNWVYDGAKLMSMTVTAGSSTYRIDYLYDENGTPYGGVYRSPATSTSPTYFTIVTDQHGNVRELLDAAGNPFIAYNYTAYGSLWGNGSAGWGSWYQGTSLISSGTAYNIMDWQPLMYSGYVYDGESGMYYCNARYYDVGTRQWTTPDPDNADGEESAYQYCGGNPVANVDPSGSNSDQFNFEYSTTKGFYWELTASQQFYPIDNNPTIGTDYLTLDGYYDYSNTSAQGTVNGAAQTIYTPHYKLTSLYSHTSTGHENDLDVYVYHWDSGVRSQKYHEGWQYKGHGHHTATKGLPVTTGGTPWYFNSKGKAQDVPGKTGTQIRCTWSVYGGNSSVLGVQTGSTYDMTNLPIW